MVIDPITTGIALQAAAGIGKSIFGLSQRSKSKKALAELNKKQLANQYIPSAIIQAAREPISQEFIEAQSMGDQRRTAQGTAAASLAGSRGVSAVLPSLLESERVSEVNRNALYNQARVEAQKQLGTYQEALRQERGNVINEGIAAQAARLGAGQTNVFNGIMDIGTSGVYLADKYSGKKILEVDNTDNTSETDSDEVASDAANASDAAKASGAALGGKDLYYDPVKRQWIKRSTIENPFLRSNNYLAQ
jgi:hypothetical protein